MDDALCAYLDEMLPQLANRRLREDVTYVRRENAPDGYTSFEVWTDRGYQPRGNQIPRYIAVPYSTTTPPFDERFIAYGLRFFGIMPLFTLAQCRKLNGEKAYIRRTAYHQATGTPEAEETLTGSEPMLGGDRHE